MQRILVPVDFSEVTQNAIAVARELSAGTKATVKLLHVVEPKSTTTQEQLRALQQTLEGQGVASEAVLAQGRVVESILEHAGGCDLMVVGSHGRSAIYKTLVGSVTEALLRDGRCPVVVIPPKAALPPDAGPRSAH